MISGSASASIAEFCVTQVYSGSVWAMPRMPPV